MTEELLSQGKSLNIQIHRLEYVLCETQKCFYNVDKRDIGEICFWYQDLIVPILQEKLNQLRKEFEEL